MLVKSDIVGNRRYLVPELSKWADIVSANDKALAINPSTDCIVSLAAKAKKVGGLYLALGDVAVRPTDSVDAKKEYTLNFAGDRSSCLQSHMLEVCPLIAVDKPKLEVHFLGIGIRKQQTARLVFTSKTGRGIKATVVDLGNRFRLISQEVECIEPKPMPNLPVASALWVPQPTFEIGAGAWILAGGTHHSAFSYDITEEYWEDFAEMLGIEYVKINKDTKTYEFKQTLRNNEVYFMLNKALK